MIAINTNAGEVAKVMRNLIARYPNELQRVLSSAGYWLRGQVKKTIRGNGPVAIQPLHPASLTIRKVLRGTSSRQQGGKLPNIIRYKKINKGVMVGAIDSGVKMFEKYQRAISKQLLPSEKQSLYRRMGARGATKSQIDTVKAAFAGGYYKPARPVMKPLSEWRELSKNLESAVVKKLNAMFNKARSAA